MKLSHYPLTTLKETPSDAEIISHQLMLRAGLIKKLGSGLYTWLPLGLRVLRRVENIIREEMNKSGAHEIFMPAVQPAELWEETGRWSRFGEQLLKIKDRQGRQFCYGPTHEEVITDIARKELHSYKQLPVNYYQIQTKFRDEIRPRFGVMRAREFMMKDAYSFHIDKNSLHETYQIMYQTYTRILSRLGLNFRAVLADTGSIGGDFSHEFHVLADSGEDTLCYSQDSDYAANVERTPILESQETRPAPVLEFEKISTPKIKKISELSQFLKIGPERLLKTLIVKGKTSPWVAILLRGDHDLNECKAIKHPLIADPLVFASQEELKTILPCEPGFFGPINLNLPIIADQALRILSDFVCGANENDYHYQGVNWERDCPLPKDFFDLRQAQAGDKSPDGQGTLALCRGIEVGHIFQLGSKYAQAMNAKVSNEQGESITLEMGCYGMGVSRLVAAAIEQNHDEKGIIWPEAMAPFQIALVPIGYHQSRRLQTAIDALYKQLIEAGFSVLLDDRNERAGTLFADMDLIGIPHRLVLGERGLDANTIEYKHRREASPKMIAMPDLLAFLQALS